MTHNGKNLKQVLLVNKLNLKNSFEYPFISLLENIVNTQNVATYLQVSSIFHLRDIRKKSLEYIYRWFTTVAKTENFQQLDLSNVNKILSSSELNISSELEVFNATDFWLNCRHFNRSKLVKKLFLKTRFPLLSDNVTKSLLVKNENLSNVSSFHKSKECLVLIKEVLKNREEFYKNKSIVYQRHRYCKSSKFNVTLCSGSTFKTGKQNLNFYHFPAENLQKVVKYTKRSQWKISNAASIKNKVYLLLNYKDSENNFKLGFVKYSPLTKSWLNLDFYYDRLLYGFCVCSFLDSLFLIGGFFYDDYRDDNDNYFVNNIDRVVNIDNDNDIVENNYDVENNDHYNNNNNFYFGFNGIFYFDNDGNVYFDNDIDDANYDNNDVYAYQDNDNNGDNNKNVNANIEKSCLLFDTTTGRWKPAAEMNDQRKYSACAVFEGRVVVSGGCDRRGTKLRTVEAYDHAADRWSRMASMVGATMGHNLIAVASKLFAVGCGPEFNSCEVYDSASERFATIKSHEFFDVSHYASVAVGNRILVFRDYSATAAVYDLDEGEWSEERFEKTEKIRDFYCVKLPSLSF